MLRLLQIEFHKLWLNRASRILIITYFTLLTSLAAIAAIKFTIGNTTIHLAEQGIFNFPYIWHFNTFMAAWFKIFLAVIIVSMVANEYSNKTLKQNLIDGLSKKEFITSKFITVVVFSLISTLFVFVVSLILGLVYSDYNEIGIIFSDLEYLIAYFVKLIGFFSFCLFIGILVKRSAFALGFLGLWFFLEMITFGMMQWKMGEGSDLPKTIVNFFPLGSMWNLIDEPFSRMSAIQTVAKQVGENLELTHQVHLQEIIIVLVWTAIFVNLSYYLLKKRDL